VARADDSIVPLIFQRLHEDFGDVDWVVWMSGPYELTNPIQTMMLEAGQKGCAVIVQATLVPSESLVPDEDDSPTLTELEQEIENSKKGK